MRLGAAVLPVLCAAAALSVVGCSDDTKGTATVAETTTAASGAATSATQAATAFDPCSLPEADLAAVGLDPSSKHVGSAGVRFPGWDICSWRGTKPNWYGLNAYSTGSHTYDEAIHNTTLYKDPQPVNVGGHNATQVKSATDDHDCTVIFDAVGGPVSFQVSAKLSAENPGDACAEAIRISGALIKDVPNIK